jgi:hypothetical protein
MIPATVQLDHINKEKQETKPMNFRWKHWGIAAVVFALSTVYSASGSAQQVTRQGQLSGILIREIASQPGNLSVNDLPALASDPNFSGDLQTVNDIASTLLSGLVIVERAGYFPENAGIPRERQFPRSHVRFAVIALDNGNEMLVWQSPERANARYLIRPGRTSSSRSIPANALPAGNRDTPDSYTTN